MIKVNGKEYPWQEGMTVATLIEELQDPYPYAVVRINKKHVSQPKFKETPIPDNAEVFLIPMVAGG